MTVAREPIAREQGRQRLGSLRSLLTTAAAAALLAAALLLPVVQSSDATTTGYSIKQHEDDLASLTAQTYRLQSDVAQLGSINRIRQDALRIGMVAPSPSPIALSVTEPAPRAVVLPRSYMPPRAESPPPTSSRGVLWTALHALKLR
jgi:hypothetical protein